MMDFVAVKELIIPEGAVASIVCAGKVLWQKAVQSEYVPVAYLESTGTQYIDTGLSGDNDNLHFELSFNVLEYGAYAGIFGNYDTEAQSCWRLLLQGQDNSKAFLSCNSKAGSSLSVDLPIGQINTVSIFRSKYILNGRTQTLGTPSAGTINTGSIVVFRMRETGAAGAPIRLYSLKIYDGDVLVRDFIPVLDSHHVPCLYDKVSGALFYNKGEGEFGYGELWPRIPADYQEVQYLESTGTQWIDTAFKANTTKSRYETKIAPRDISSTRAVFGSRNTSSGSSTDNCEVFNVTNKTFRLDWASGGANLNSAPLEVDAAYEINITRGVAYVNGVKYSGTNSTSVDQRYSFLVGNLANGASGPYSNGFVGKIYYAKLFHLEGLARDFIPCYRKSDGKPGMYDTVTQKFFTNAGTGEFLYGGDV